LQNLDVLEYAKNIKEGVQKESLVTPIASPIA
jgi:hypothetical protein